MNQDRGLPALIWLKSSRICTAVRPEASNNNNAGGQGGIAAVEPTPSFNPVGRAAMLLVQPAVAGVRPDDGDAPIAAIHLRPSSQ
jgi:hypothetical protein